MKTWLLLYGSLGLTFRCPGRSRALNTKNEVILTCFELCPYDSDIAVLGSLEGPSWF